MRIRLSRTSQVLLAIVALLAVGLLLFQWNWLRHPIERWVTEHTGRALVIAGDLDVKLRWHPVIRADAVSFDNPPWAAERRLITARRMEFTLDLPALLHRRVLFHRIALVEPRVALERDAQGRRSWVLSRTGEAREGGAVPEIRLLQVERGRLDYRDAPARIAFVAEVDIASQRADLKSPQPERLPTHIAVTGRYRDAPFAGRAWAGSVLSVQDADTPFPLVVNVKAGDTEVDADGTITNLLKLTRIDTRLRIKGPDLSKLYPVIALPLPRSPPYAFDGHFRRSGDTYVYEGFKGRVGGSDIAGNATYVYREPRPVLKATLASRLLDLKDLGPLIGLKPHARKPAETRRTVSFQRGAKGGEPAGEHRKVLPDEPFKLNRLRAMDADVTLKAGQIRRPEALPLEDLRTHLVLEDGVLRLDPLDFGFAGGDIVSKIRIDAHRDPLAARADVNLRKLQLNKLFPTVKLMQDSRGLLGAQLKVDGRGNSVADMLASSNGDAALAMSGGELSNMLMEAVGLDAGELLKFLIEGDRKTAVRCAIAAFKVRNGEARTDTFVFDTVDTIIRGDGSLNLGEETFDMWLRPYPKDKSILVARVPVRVYGSFDAPRYAPDKAGLIARGGAAVALGLINPVAALIPLIETGPGRDSDCNALLAPVRGALKQADPAHPAPKPVPSSPKEERAR